MPPQALVEAAHSVVGVGCALAVGDPVEEVAVVGALLPHAFHLGATWLEVAEILLAQPRLLVDFDVGAAKGRGLRVVGGEGCEETLCGFAGAAVGRREDLEGVVWAEKVAEAAACFVGLGPSFWCEFYSVIWDGLVYLAVFWAISV